MSVPPVTPCLTLQDLADYLGVKDPESVRGAWEAANALVDGYVRGYEVSLDDPMSFIVGKYIVSSGIPAAVYAQAILEVGADLFNRKSAKNGVAQFGVMGEQSPIRINRDPLVAARPLLAPFLIGGGLA